VNFPVSLRGTLFLSRFPSIPKLPNIQTPKHHSYNAFAFSIHNLPSPFDQTYRHSPSTTVYKLNLSKLRRSPLLCLLTTPNLKYLSSPVAVRPPMYHFSFPGPSTSRNPSLELSLPRRYLRADTPVSAAVVVGGEFGPGERERGEAAWLCRGEWREESAAVAVGVGLEAEVDVDVVMERGFDGCEWEGAAVVVPVGFEGEDCCRAEWARKAARKLARNGL